MKSSERGLGTRLGLRLLWGVGPHSEPLWSKIFIIVGGGATHTVLLMV